MTRKALGKGLRALIPDPAESGIEPDATEVGQDVALAEPEASLSAGSGPADDHIAVSPLRLRETLKHLPLDLIVANPNQPRTTWDPSSLAELVQSIREKGLLEPIVVRPTGDHFELVAGERRWRACRLAGWSEIPAIVRSFGEHESLEAALIENIQRSDLNPVDEARAYQTLATKYALTHEDIAKKVGKDRSTVSNLLRLLRLPQTVLDHVSRGTLTVGHVKVLLGLPEAQVLAAAEKIIKDGWSVRQVEEWAAEAANVAGKRHKGRRVHRGIPKTEHIQRIEQNLCRRFATDARIRFSRKGGRVEIRFHDEEDLSRILELLGVVVI
jgi:ParB family transcriptional regulator, chromosome partitioning protein